MFRTVHFIWMAICFLVIGGTLSYLRKTRLPIIKVLSGACVACIASSMVKTLTMLKTVPSADGSAMYLYLELSNLPLHLCSLQILCIFYARFTKNEKGRETILAFLYPAGTLGGLLAILVPPLLSDMPGFQAFANPRAYQYFLYHSAIIILGLYVALSGQVHLRARHYLSTMIILVLLTYLSIYLNSMFASPVYEGGRLISVEYMPNFFFTQAIPINIPFSEKWHWFAWWGGMVVLALVLVGLMYLPFMLKELKENKVK